VVVVVLAAVAAAAQRIQVQLLDRAVVAAATMVELPVVL
jgi:hypothetical protein